MATDHARTTHTERRSDRWRQAPALLIAADETDGVHWRVGYNNFYVITRYNHSALYAMAVFELAAAVKQRVLMNDAANTAASGAAP